MNFHLLLYDVDNPPTTTLIYTSIMSELAVSYAALILADAEVEITADKLQALVTAAGVENVEPVSFMPPLLLLSLDVKPAFS